MFFFTDTATPEIYTLSLHDALPICRRWLVCFWHCELQVWNTYDGIRALRRNGRRRFRSEEHTSELQSLRHLVCRLLLEKKKHATTAVFVRLQCVPLTGMDARTRRKT